MQWLENDWPGWIVLAVTFSVDQSVLWTSCHCSPLLSVLPPWFFLICICVKTGELQCIKHQPLPPFSFLSSWCFGRRKLDRAVLNICSVCYFVCTGCYLLTSLIHEILHQWKKLQKNIRRYMFADTIFWILFFLIFAFLISLDL